MAECLFCKIAAREIPAAVTYRDDHVLAFKDIGPKAPMHELVIPLRHLGGLGDAAAEDEGLLGRLLLVAARRAKEAGFGQSGYRVVVNSGPDAGQSVFHVHVHVLAGRPLAWPPG